MNKAKTEIITPHDKCARCQSDTGIHSCHFSKLVPVHNYSPGQNGHQPWWDDASLCDMCYFLAFGDIMDNSAEWMAPYLVAAVSFLVFGFHISPELAIREAGYLTQYYKGESYVIPANQRVGQGE